MSETITIILGTAGNDELTGTLGDDTINGKGGADLMVGLSGNDTYIANTEADEVVEQSGEGTDAIRAFGSYVLPANVEKLVLTGTQDGVGVGNGLANRINGNSGYNTLDGRSGNDTLIGRSGPDLFRFTSALNASTNVDRLTDFNVSEDRIALHYTAFPAFTWSSGGGSLEGSKFHVGAFATTASHRIVYNKESGALLYDPDGAGRAQAVRFATLPAHLALTSGNFLVWARYYI
jgi:Ca2+-binding RTX toxin-like protein